MYHDAASQQPHVWDEQWSFAICFLCSLCTYSLTGPPSSLLGHYLSSGAALGPLSVLKGRRLVIPAHHKAEWTQQLTKRDNITFGFGFTTTSSPGTFDPVRTTNIDPRWNSPLVHSKVEWTTTRRSGYNSHKLTAQAEATRCEDNPR